MSKDKETTPPGGDKNGDAVGYCRPPKHSQFRPGQSGNPAGRRKGVHNLATDVKRTLMVPVRMKEGGRTRAISTQEGALMMLRDKALKGDARSLDRLIELALRFNNDAGEIGLTQVLGADDQAILDAYRAEIAATTIRPITAESGGHQSTLPTNSAKKSE
jgi:Family of unknown function (DUF5681)